MKALFIHDHKFYVNSSNTVFSSGKLPYSVWCRYLEHFDELVVVGRSLSLLDNDSERFDLSSGKNVSFIFVPNLASPVAIFRYLPEVIKSLKEAINSVDAVIARGSVLGGIAALLAQKMGKPVAFEVVGCTWDGYWNYGTVLGKICAPFAFYFQKRIVRHSKYSLYVTQNFLQHRYPCFGVTSGVSNVDIPEPSNFVLEERLRRIESVRLPFVFGLIGSLHSQYKGIQTVFYALNMIQKKLPQYEFQILGDGSPSKWIKLAKSLNLDDKVRFIGTLTSGDAVFNWLDSIDVYLQPSLTEGLPRSLVEALSRGCPAIGSTAGGIPELLEASVVHKPKDAVQLSNLILASLDPQWQKKQAFKNFKTAQSYSIDILKNRRSEFWNSFSTHVRQGL